MAPAVLGAVRHLPAGAGRGWWRPPPRPGADQPRRRRSRPRPDGDGDHPVHGRRLGRPPQPRRLAGLRDAPRLPLASPARLHRRPTPRRDPCQPLPARRVRRRRKPRRDAPRPRLCELAGAADGDRADGGPGERHPRHRLGGPERRGDRRARGRRLHRARRIVGRTGQRRVHEPGALVRAGARRRRLLELLGLRGRSARGRRDRGRASPTSCADAAATRSPAPPGRASWRPGAARRSPGSLRTSMRVASCLRGSARPRSQAIHDTSIGRGAFIAHAPSSGLGIGLAALGASATPSRPKLMDQSAGPPTKPSFSTTS